MQRGESSLEAETIAVNHILKPYKSYKDLPLVSTGCDSYASWHHAFKDLSPYYTIPEIVEKITSLLPYKRWVDEHLVITGGEPLLGWQQLYPELLEHESMRGLRELTFETNGTQKLYPELISYLDQWGKHREKHCVTFSVSPKLSVSGENHSDAIKPEVVAEYCWHGHVYLKFVVASEQDIEEAVEAVNLYKKAGFKGNVYLMPVGGVESVYQLNNKNVALAAMKLGYRYSDRLQVPLFKNEWGT